MSRMANDDAENAALMQQIERTIPPMNLKDAEKLLLEADGQRES